jgi:hypothetical protein
MMKKVLLVLVVAFIGLVALAIFGADNERQSRIDEAATPEQFATALLSDGKTQATLNVE